jgi:hypothetical protein
VTVGELIRKLRRHAPERDVYVSVHTATQAYSVAKVPIKMIDQFVNDGGVALTVWLPDNMHTVTRRDREAPEVKP